ncbi:glycine oxidase ThiO [bacterium]|nr:glycine oxidase ThiO [bacterium]
MSNPIVVIGGGVIGLSIAHHLAFRHQDVLVVEKNTCGSGASLKAAGMITPASEVVFGEEKLLNLFIESHKRYPGFVKKLQTLSDLSVDFIANGSLTVALDQDDLKEMNRIFEFHKKLGLPAEKLSKKQLLQMESYLTSDCVEALYSNNEYCIDNRKLVNALVRAIKVQGGKILENTHVTSIAREKNGEYILHNTSTPIKASQVVLASGVETYPSSELTKNIPALRPVKGQALELKTVLDHPITRPIRTIHRFPMYLVPRSDNRLILGATKEEMGFDARVTAGAMLELIYAASRTLPMVEEMEVLSSWAGHRAAFRDHAPVLGPIDDENFVLALGFYRHGIMLTPLIGEIIADYLTERKYSPFMDEWGMGRFK